MKAPRAWQGIRGNRSVVAIPVRFDQDAKRAVIFLALGQQAVSGLLGPVDDVVDI